MYLTLCMFESILNSLCDSEILRRIIHFGEPARASALKANQSNQMFYFMSVHIEVILDNNKTNDKKQK